MKRSKLQITLRAEVGLVLTDLSFRVIACDRGAAAILNGANRPNEQSGNLPCLPRELVDILRSRGFVDQTPSRACLHIGSSEYNCRAYLVEGGGGRLTESVVALHLEKDLSASEAASEMGARYHLTERELEALEGILMGLGNKEVASRMKISPNTVKAFLHLIMIKMGVATRAGIVAKVLHNRAAFEKTASMPGSASRRLVLDKVGASHAVALGNTAPKASGGSWRELIGEVTNGEDVLDQPAHNSLPYRIRRPIDTKEGS
jgi:DNA-binding CsgD family transcriptional regulator